MSNFTLSLRGLHNGPDHHLWNNNGTWWCHYTAHSQDYRAVRVRRSLRTRILDTARNRRDALLKCLATEGRCA